MHTSTTICFGHHQVEITRTYKEKIYWAVVLPSTVMRYTSVKGRPTAPRLCNLISTRWWPKRVIVDVFIVLKILCLIWLKKQLSINRHNGITIPKDKRISIPKLRAAAELTAGIWLEFQNYKQVTDCLDWGVLFDLAHVKRASALVPHPSVR